MLVRARPPHVKSFMTTTRDNVRALTVGPVAASGTAKLPVSADELLEPFCLAIQGSPTPTIPTGGTASKQYVFRPGSAAPDSGTIEWQDGARAWTGSGYQVDSFDVTGSTLGENICTINLFGQNVVAMPAITAALPQRTPTFFEGWETRLYLDAFGAVPGTTAIQGTLINWSVKFSNAMTRKYVANNTLAAFATPVGFLAVTGDFLFEATAATALAEFGMWENGSASPTKRLARLEFGNNTTLETTIKSRVMLDIPMAYTVVDLGQSDAGTRAYKFSFNYVFDPVNGYGFSATCVTNRTTLYA